PRHSAHPIEIVVRHNRVVSQETDERKPSIVVPCSSRQPPYRFRTIAEGEDRVGRDSQTSSEFTRPLPVRKFKKGHRRAFSMPSSGNRMTLSIIDDDQLMADGLHKRHVVRYRLHPHKRRLSPQAPNESTVVSAALIELPAADQDDNELAIEINEEEIICASGGDDKSGPRTVIKKFWEARWKVTNFEFLPVWLQDNEYLRTGHRPPLPSFGSCFKSIFSLHTETGNIWTHLFGCVAFVGVALFFFSRPNALVQWQEKLVFSSFFMGAISCLGMSFAFHTVQCHSVGVGKLFSKLDYTGISLLIVGSFIPWIYYGFYCRTLPMVIHMSMICILGIAAVTVSLWDKFAAPQFRPVRAFVFVAMGLSSIVPALHFFITDGIRVLLDEASFHWLLLMGILYLTGAAVYASRTPERCFPGKCDLLFQSHQLFHLFVVVAAFVHFHGISEMAMKRLQQGSCAEQIYERYGEQFTPSFIDNWLALDSL
ncbi:unnamed protein product, partial [Toxocara canis]|uniref:Adiponectin receptor protein n=1 Tax=Toxocara canis TaxID=6265 RepID=A0A183UNV8_TOXCA